MSLTATQAHLGFEDEHFVIAWKPHGILTSGNSGRTFDRIVNRTLCIPPGSGVLPCNRLDFGTSGWVVFGKYKQAARAMGLLFEKRSITKRYVALVHEQFPIAMTTAWPLDGKPATTHLALLAKGRIAGAGPVSFIHAEPITGRTHQIRRHLFQSGHGIVGDDHYGIPGNRYKGKGLFLCAYGVAFNHPMIHHFKVDIEAKPSRKFRKLPFVDQSDFIRRFNLSSCE